jgi:AraC-like DNA-binding protein
MTKKVPFYFAEWEGRKANFPFNLEIHTIDCVFENHRHSFSEFYYVFEGSGYEIINGKSHGIKPGTFTLLLPYQAHELHSNEGEVLKIYNCSMRLDVFFGPNKIGVGLNEMLFKNEEELSPYVHFDGDTASRVLDIFKAMKEEYDREPIWSDLMFKSKLVEVLVLYDRARRPEASLGCERTQDKNSSIWDVVYYIHNHYSEDITLSSLAEHFYLSTSYLSGLFRKAIGKTFVEFLNEIRILHACSLLTSTDLPVTQIAYDVGFRSYSSFSRVFQENKNMSAVEYRKRINF